MQYTLRKIPAAVDAALRRRARREGRSLNEVAVEALAAGASVEAPSARPRNVSDVAGKWHEDPEFDQAVLDQHRIDEDLWR